MILKVVKLLTTLVVEVGKEFRGLIKRWGEEVNLDFGRVAAPPKTEQSRVFPFNCGNKTGRKLTRTTSPASNPQTKRPQTPAHSNIGS